MLGAKKAGHAGTLDPMATGVLPVALNKAAKLMPALQSLDKEYDAVMHLHQDVSNSELEAALKKFIGRIKQKPPVRSAVARVERERTIFGIKILERKGKDVTIHVACEAGTYIRKLIHDAGLGIGGSHMAAIRRTKAGPFSLEQCHSIQKIKLAARSDSCSREQLRNILMLPEAAVSHLKAVIVKDSAVRSLCTGAQLYTTGISKLYSNIKSNELVALLTGKGELIGLGKSAIDSNELRKNKSKRIIVKPVEIIMDKDTYPNFRAY